MRWLADECIPSDVVRDLRNAGHDVVYAAETFRQTADVDLADEALRDRRILITEDKDFGELAFQKLRAMPGTVLLRFPRTRRALKSPCLLEAIERHGSALQDKFAVIEEGRVRLRPIGHGG